VEHRLKRFSARHALEAAGRKAVDLLLERTADGAPVSDSSLHVLLGTDLIIRATTAPPSASRKVIVGSTNRMARRTLHP